MQEICLFVYRTDFLRKFQLFSKMNPSERKCSKEENRFDLVYFILESNEQQIEGRMMN